jgi:predicted transcriptional regulator
VRKLPKFSRKDGFVNPVEDALISIRPGYADAIFSGTKTIELRRRIPPTAAGLRLWIYVTKPVGAVLGIAEVKEVIAGSPATVWEKCGDGAGLTRQEFDQYFESSKTAFGLVLSNVKKGVPATMDVLKLMRPGFHPPQVMTRLSAAEAKSLKLHIFHP